MGHPLDTAEGLLAEALRWESIARQCSAGDPAKHMALREVDWYLNEAAKKEREVG